MSRSAPPESTSILAVDTGGTFTDLVHWSPAGLRRFKTPSTPDDPSEAVLRGIRQMATSTGSEDDAPGAPALILHGSTVGTNALLERKGATVALVTNAGFEDVIEIGRQNRPQLYALVGHRPPPLVERERRIGIQGRLDFRGNEIEPVNRDELSELPARVGDAEAVAVVLLHSYADGAHERLVRESLADIEIPVSLSSEILPEYREYERTSTTVVNAYISPLMSRYLERLDRETGASRVRIMGSSGGALPVERARAEAVHTVLSGPAGGVVGARAWGERCGFSDILTFDMGGTSTDVSVCPGEPLRTNEFQIGGQPVAIPVLDIHTVGAGGGSLARVDPGGALKVGPESAGADPGPICYGRGGEGVTVTDANVWLGRLPTGDFLGGEMTLDRDAIRPHLETLADGLGCSLEEAAEGIVAVADSAMERALRVISVEKGYDPAEFVLVAFGGAGGLHVAELAARLGARSALVPPDPGLLSAYGMLTAPVTRESSRTLLVEAGDPDNAAVMEAAFEELEAEGLEGMESEGVDDPSDLSVRRSVDARYRGQSFELRVPAEDWVARFHRAHEERYGYARRDRPVEAVTLRVVVSAPAPRIQEERLDQGSGAPETIPVPSHVDGRWGEIPCAMRDSMGAGDRLSGPAVITEYSATTWIPSGWTARMDELGCLHLLPAS